MAASNIVIVTKNTAQAYTQGGNTVSSASPAGRLLSVLEVDTNFINLKQGLVDLEYTSATKDSPVFTGTPTAPTAGVGTNNSQLATTQFVVTELAAELGPIETTVNSSIIGNQALNNKISTKANLSGGANFSGTLRISGLNQPAVLSDSQHIVTTGVLDYKFLNIDDHILFSSGNSYDIGNPTNFVRTIYTNKILPGGSGSSIGTASQPFDEGYFANNTVFIGSAALSQGAAGGLVLPSNSAFGDEDSVVPRNLISTDLDKAFGNLSSSPSRAIKTTLEASGSINSGDPVLLNANGTVSVISTSNVDFIGFASTSATNGNDVDIILSGPVTGLSGLVSGSEVLLSTTGTLKFSRTLTTDIKIGTATSTTQLFLYSTSTIDTYALSNSKTELSDFSVTTASSGNNALTYDSSTGVFEFTPVNLSTYATQSYVDTEIANLVNSAPTALDTLDELAAALNDDANFATTVTNSIATKAPIDSPTLTGTPAAPTAASNTNTTQIATTAFVQGEITNKIELTDLSVGTAAASSGGALSYNSATGAFTFTPADTSSFGNASLASFSVTTNSASGNGNLSYNNTNGVFTFTPADLSSYLTSYTETDPVVGAINGIVKADGTGNISAAVAGTDYSTFNGAFSSLTGTPTTVAGYGITDAFNGAFSSLTGTPTTIAGYGITDPIAYTNVDIDIGSNDFITTGQIYYSNVFAQTSNLPSASTYHGMFAHVHATGKGYFAHAGNWVELANASTTLAGYGITDGATITYVDTEIANLIDSAPGALDTLNELAAALGDDANFSTTVTNSLALKAPLADPALTGTPTAPTAAASTNTTQIATTAFVQQEIGGLTSYADSDVDTHLNTSTASSGEVLSWNGTDYDWVAQSGGGGGGASVTVSDAAPSNPSAGDLWFDSTGLVLYVYYNDGDSSQWVQTNPSGSSSGSSGGGASVSVSGTAPTSPSAGDLWFDDDDLFLYVYVSDGSSSQWVKTNPSGGGSSSTWAEKTAAYTAEAGDRLIVDTSTAVTVTLPATAALGDEIRIIDGTGTASTNNITVARNGHNIEGTAADLTIDVDRAAFGLVYYNATQGWVMMER